MALVKCYECQNQISDAALACPNCGAPVKAQTATQTAPLESDLKCPFCMNPVHENAITCGNCGAEYGFHDGRRVYSSKWTVLIFGVLLPFVLTILAFNWNEGIGLIVGLIMLFIILKALWQLIRGRRWYKYR